MKKYILIIVSLVTMQFVSGQEATKGKKVETIEIQTSAICEDCKERIENALNYTKGVVFAELNNETKKVTVKYKINVISPLQIKQKITEIGYDADELKAKNEGFQKLPMCCRPGSKMK